MGHPVPHMDLPHCLAITQKVPSPSPPPCYPGRENRGEPLPIKAPPGHFGPAVTRNIRRPHKNQTIASGTGSTTALRAHLPVRFDRAADFVAQYAENVTRDGFYAVGEHEFERLSEIDLEVSLPGLGAVVAPARVIYCSEGGTGLDISRCHHFKATLLEFLRKLGQRRLLTVVSCVPELAPRLRDAGYRVCVTTPATLRDLIRDTAVDAVVVWPNAGPSLDGISRTSVVPYHSDFDRLCVDLDRLAPN